jgi:sulfur transfer complex TusBCD TusB component (DsrH family)
MSDDFFIEIACHQENKYGKLVCGDVFLSQKIKAENRTIAVLSDGLGSGVKANILATMTASMAMNFTINNEPISRTAKTITNTLPIDAERQINYATFTIVTIDGDGETTLVEYDNPPFYLIRNGKAFTLIPKESEIYDGSFTRTLLEYKFQACKEDRLLIISDGISQAGIGSPQMPFGWGEESVLDFACEQIAAKPDISARNLSNRILQQAKMCDGLKLKDDASCGIIYFRAPRKLLICSGPPYHKESDATLAELVQKFKGAKIICGGTTAQIIARELGKTIETGLFDMHSDLPPSSKMEGINLVTEGILTLGKVVQILEDETNLNNAGLDVAAEIVKFFHETDAIHLLIGTKVNNAHQDPNLPMELEIRRNVLKKMAHLLETKYLKQVSIQYL